MNKVVLPSQIASCCKALAFAGLAAAALHAFPCDKAYHLQSATEVILTGKKLDELTRQSSKVFDKTLDGASLLFDSTEYKIVTDFEGAGSCETQKLTNIDYAYRAKKGTSFGPLHESNRYVQFVPGDNPFGGVAMDYWFGLTASTDSTAAYFAVIGKPKAMSQLQAWYGNATLEKTIVDPVLGTKKPGGSTRFYWNALTHLDSTVLFKSLTDAWKTEVNNDSIHLNFKIQIIKVVYDSTAPTPLGLRGARTKVAGFHAEQVGNLVLINAGEWKQGVSEPLGLFNMMGQKVAALHPTGYLYQWNGKSSMGGDAGTGVYFVQSGSRVLGKFFYTR
jgi:hypothetical protein